MKLYCWIPGGHCAFTFRVLAESEQKARELVDKMVEDIDKAHNEKMKAYSPITHRYQRMHGIQQWGTDFYTLEVYEPHEVIVEED